MLRAVDSNDSDFVYRVFAATRAELLAALADWGEDQKEAFLRFQFQTQHDQYRSRYPGARFDVVVADGEDIGRLYVAPTGDDFRLVDIALLSVHRNRGIGRALLQDLLDEASRLGKRVSLHVEVQSPASRLYARLGFVEAGEEGIYRRMEWVPPKLGSARDGDTIG